MKKNIFLFSFLFVVLAFGISNAQLPTFEVRVQNLVLDDTLGGNDNVLLFDIYLQHTNLPVSGPFELALNSYYFDFDPAIANGGTLTYRKVPGTSQFSNPLAIPFASAISGSILNLLPNVALGAGNGPIINTVFPGTRVITMRLATTAPSFSLQSLSMAFRTALPNPFTKVFAYIGTTSTEITTNGTYIVDPSVNIPLPVELASFTSTTSRNNVTLNWTTTKEINNSGFDIERKLVSETDWSKIGNVTGSGNTNETKNYTFPDRITSGKYNYRLKQIDFNGNFTYFNLSGEVEVGIPSVYNMSQNYPNPFNPTTKIDYDIPYDGKVSVLLYDMTGREVASLVNEIKTAGYYTANFNASNLASGMYFYRLVASQSSPITAQGGSNNFVMTKKMVLLK